MATVRDLIKRSLVLIGATASGETPSADEQADALASLNDMVSSWSTESLIIHTKVREKFSLVVGQASRTIGVSGNFNTSRPLQILNAAIEDQSSVSLPEYPMQIITLDEWAAIQLKSTESAYPTKLYVEDTYPLAILNLWPVPSVANKLVLYSWKPLAAFSSVNDTVDLPPGYARALRYNLAIELAPEYGKIISQETAAIANGSKANIKIMNIKPIYLDCDTGMLDRSRSNFNIYIGE